MATFSASPTRETHAADALACVAEILDAAESWSARRAAQGLPVRAVNAAVASGRVLFGAVGEKDRLEYTVIGDAVNLAAKLEKHNSVLGSRAVTTAVTFAEAQRQGYRPAREPRHVPQARVEGVSQPVDLAVLAAGQG
jgi:adenylate cyclase